MMDPRTFPIEVNVPWLVGWASVTFIRMVLAVIRKVGAVPLAVVWCRVMI